ncbi:unnamed protein product, partial [Symbiodinium sp. CCMP2592]
MADVADGTTWTSVQAETFLKACVLCRKGSKIELGLIRKPEGLVLVREELMNFTRALEKLLRPSDARQEHGMSPLTETVIVGVPEQAPDVYHYQNPDRAGHHEDEYMSMVWSGGMPDGALEDKKNQGIWAHMDPTEPG